MCRVPAAACWCEAAVSTCLPLCCAVGKEAVAGLSDTGEDVCVVEPASMLATQQAALAAVCIST